MLFFLLPLIVTFTYAQTTLPSTFPTFYQSSCSTDYDCADVFSPTCVNGTCTGCGSSSDCGHMSSSAACSGGQCVIPCSITDFTSCWELRITCDSTHSRCAQCSIDADCIGYPGPVWCQSHPGFGNLCANCRTTADCTAGYTCSNLRCVQCASNTDCPANTPICSHTFNTDTCVQCIDATDCPTSKPFCLTNKCVECTASTDCTNSNKPFCNDTMECVECLASTDCTTIGSSACNLGTNVCEVCGSNADCSNFPLTPACATGVGCVQCAANSDCTNPVKPFCNLGSHTCDFCNSNGDCSLSPTTPVCAPGVGCVGCLFPTDCTNLALSYCNPNTYSCEICTSNTGCSQFPLTPACATGLGCVECVTSPDCTNPAHSYCNSHACQICNSNTDCSHLPLTQICVAGVGCVECTNSNECTTPAKAYCNAPITTCEICQTDSDCTKFGMICSSTLGCVECLNSAQCTTPARPYCEVSTSVCTSCRDNNDCAKFATEQICSSNGQCCDPSNPTCVPASLSPKELEQMKTIASVGDATGIAATVAILLTNVLSLGDSGGTSGGILAKILQYIKYINVSYSLRLEALFKYYHTPPGSLSFLAPNVPDSVIQAFPYQEVPPTFAEYNVYSSFIVNFWKSLISLLILSGIFIAIRGAEWIWRKRSPKDKLRTVSRQTRIVAQNFLILEFYNIYCDIVLFSSLQITRTDWASPASVISFLISTALVIIGFHLLAVHVIVLHRYQLQYTRGQKGNPGKRDRALELYILKNRGFKAFFQNFKDNSFARQAFLLFFSVRSILSNLIIAFLYDSPIAQAALITSMTVLFFIYLIVMRPFKALINFTQQIIYEALFLIVNICLLTLAVIDNSESPSARQTENLCDIIIIVSMIFSFIPNLFVMAKIVSAIYTYCNPPKSGVRRHKKSKSNLRNFSPKDIRKSPQDTESQSPQGARIARPINSFQDLQHDTNTLNMDLSLSGDINQDITKYHPSFTSQERQLDIRSPQGRPKIKRSDKKNDYGIQINSNNKQINFDNSEIQNDNSLTMQTLNVESEFEHQRIIQGNTGSPKRGKKTDSKKKRLQRNQ